MAGWESAGRKSPVNCCRAPPVGAWAANCAISAWISASWARRKSADEVFFDSREPFLAAAGAEHLHIFREERLQLRMGGKIFLNCGNLVGRDILGDVVAVLPMLKVVVRAIGTLPQDAELALFEALDAGDLLEETFGSG